MITYGFFNSLNGDRKYTAEDFNDFFEGLISDNGIFQTVGNAFTVSPGVSGLSVQVGTGKALVNRHWAKNPQVETIVLETAHSVLNRYDAICLRWSAENREITLNVKTGTAAVTPEKPTPTRSKSTVELILAYVYIKGGATSITFSDISDTRFDNDVCGIITGIIKQADISTIFKEYISKFQQLEQALTTWKNLQQVDFNNWLDMLTSELTVKTSFRRFTYNYTATRENGTQYVDVPSEVYFEEGDVLDIFVNGVHMAEGIDYTLMTNEVENVPMIFFHADIPKDNIITFYNLISDINRDYVDFATDYKAEADAILALQEEYISGDGV